MDHDTLSDVLRSLVSNCTAAARADLHVATAARQARGRGTSYDALPFAWRTRHALAQRPARTGTRRRRPARTPAEGDRRPPDPRRLHRRGACVDRSDRGREPATARRTARAARALVARGVRADRVAPLRGGRRGAVRPGRIRDPLPGARRRRRRRHLALFGQPRRRRRAGQHRPVQAVDAAEGRRQGGARAARRDGAARASSAASS